jgi:hypothetical protein
MRGLGSGRVLPKTLLPNSLNKLFYESMRAGSIYARWKNWIEVSLASTWRDARVTGYGLRIDRLIDVYA